MEPMSADRINVFERLNLGNGRRVPMILQTEASECGLASLAMIASYHGHHTDLTDLRRRFGMSLRGATLRDLVRVADQLGLAAELIGKQSPTFPIVLGHAVFDRGDRVVACKAHIIIRHLGRR